MKARAIEFLRPTFFALVGFGLVVGVGNLTFLNAPRPEEQGPEGFLPGEAGRLDLGSVVLPRPDLAPEEVVKLQLAGLSDQKSDGVGILQCYCFASPANRAVTGPLERFGRIVRQGPYQCLARPRALLVGRPQIEREAARVLVTLVDEQTVVRAFTFVLARQHDGPLQGCWMTDGVFPASPSSGLKDSTAKPST
jgi:hypothetical protein